MSSPFHTLKKNRVPLFLGHMTGNRPVPFRSPAYSEDECRLLEEITTSMVQERRKQDPFTGLPRLSTSPRKPGKQKSGLSSPRVSPERPDDTKLPPTDHDLMRMMMDKIAALEKQNQMQETEVHAKDRQIKVLEDRLQIAEKARQENVSSSSMKDLETHCLLLQQQVHEMETFLAEYGLVWVGEPGNEHSDVYLEDDVDDDEEEGEEENNILTETSLTSDSPVISVASSNPFGVWRQDASLPAPSQPLNLDFNQLMENIRDLNVLAGEGVAQIRKTAEGARFEIPDPVQLTIYANGILMFDGPFRPYTELSTRQCVQDLMDGYFPSELQNRYPDGVPFVVTDLRGTHFQPKHTSLAFVGQGQTLGGEARPSRLVSSTQREGTNKMSSIISASADQKSGPFVTTSTLPGQPVAQTQFLNKLPKSVVKNGKIISVRNSISKILTGDTDTNTSKPNVTLISTDVTKEMSKKVSIPGQATERPKSHKGQGDVTTLRVMNEKGDHTYILKMKFTETVGDLRTYLDAQRHHVVPYDIVSTFPHKVHKNNSLSLEESGLTPNAVLHLKPVKQ